MNRQQTDPECPNCHTTMYVYQYAIQQNGAKRPKRATCDECGNDERLTAVATDGGGNA